ncbi:hypothetical protein AS589_09165 [Empedobacter brevis]|nr:hypothetical protein AS589_09165 [Empedobacter brevis]
MRNFLDKLKTKASIDAFFNAICLTSSLFSKFISLYYSIIVVFSLLSSFISRLLYSLSCAFIYICLRLKKPLIIIK